MRAKRGTVGVGGNVVEMMRRGEGSFLLWLAASTAHPCRSPGRRKGGNPGVPMHVNFKPTATVYDVFEGAEVAFSFASFHLGKGGGKYLAPTTLFHWRNRQQFSLRLLAARANQTVGSR